jgi:CBS domain-containing protein
MLVQQILKTKSDDGVVTVTPTSTISDAVAILSARKIGALVVSPDGKRVVGILRDIVRTLGQRGAAILTESVESQMTSEIVSCSRNERSAEVLAKMTKGRFRHMPVLDGDQMVGLISIGDVVKAQLSELSMEKEALESMIKGF